MILKGDFHIHSLMSDGKNTVEEIFQIAKTKGLDFISITDHDTTAAVESALELSKTSTLTLIPALELSTVYNNENVHILAYFKDNSYNKADFQEFLEKIRDSRVIRAKKIIENLKKFFNIDLDFDEVFRESMGTLARPHIAKAIIHKGYNYSYNYIFENFISTDSPAYVPYDRVPTKDAIKTLKSFNAIPVLAHPVLIKKSPIEELLSFGFEGIEAIYPLNKKGDEARFRSLAKDFNIFVTAGSDFHGNLSGDSKHGDLGDVSLTGEDLEIFLRNFNVKFNHL